MPSRAGVTVTLCMIHGFMAPSAAAQWYQGITLRATLDPKVLPRAALAQAVFPADSPSTIVIAAALRYALPVDPLLEVGPGIEWQRNAGQDKKQNSLKFGVSPEWSLRDIGAAAHHPWTPILLGQANYKRDAIKSTSSAQLALSFSLLFRGHGLGLRHFYIPTLLPTTPKLLAFRYQPYVGLELDTKAADSVASSVRRVLGRLQLEAYPFPKPLGYRLQLVGDYTYRRGSADEEARRGQHTLTASANVF